MKKAYLLYTCDTLEEELCFNLVTKYFYEGLLRKGPEPKAAVRHRACPL